MFGVIWCPNKSIKKHFDVFLASSKIKATKVFVKFAGRWINFIYNKLSIFVF